MGKITYVKSEILESENFEFQSYFEIDEQSDWGNYVDYCIFIRPKACDFVKPNILKFMYIESAERISKIDMGGEFPAKIDIGIEFGTRVHIKREENGDFDIEIELDGEADQNAVTLNFGYLFTEDDMRKFIESGKWLCDNDSDSLRK